MIDYERIALDALAKIELSPDRRKTEFNNLVTVMQAEIGDLRQHGIPQDEIEQTMRTWADLHVDVLRM